MNRIVIFGPYPPPYGGVSIYNERIYNYLKEANFECLLKIYRENPLESDMTVTPDFKSVYKSFANLDNNDICLDSCTFFIEYPSIKSILAWLFTKYKRRFKWIKIIHDGSLPARYKDYSLFKKFFVRWILKTADVLVPVSEPLYAWLRHTMKAKNNTKLIKSLLPIPASIFYAPIDKNLNEQFNTFEKVICSIGTFVPDYGFKQIISAVEQIRENTKRNIGLIIIDGAFAEDPDYKQSILQNRTWVIVNKNVPHSQVIQILKRCDVFVRGFSNESLGLSRIESLWCNTPVVATKNGETRGMRLYDFDDEISLRKQILSALKEPDKELINTWSLHFLHEAESNLESFLNLLIDQKRQTDEGR